jgi:hypothetical protein
MVCGQQDTVMSFIRFLMELDMVKVIKIGRLRWLGQLIRMQELDPCRKLTVLKPEGTRRLGKPKLRWLESFEEDLKNMGVRN